MTGDPHADGHLAIRNLTLDFLTGVRTLRALDDVTLDIAPGEIVGLVGESGSGKTTLGKAILGMLKPSGGAIRYRGHDLVALTPGQRQPLRRDMQMVFQDPLSSFNPRFTIASSLALPLRLHGISPPEAVEGEVAGLLRRVGLNADHGMRYPHELSGGQLQRVAIARAISVRPRVIVADEAVSKLDVSVRAQVLNLLLRMNRETGASIVFITHDLGVARFLCHRIAVMYFGRIVETGRSADIFSAPGHPYTQSLIEARHPGKRRIVTDADEAQLPVLNPAEACNYAPRCLARLPACLEARPPLEPTRDGHLCACFAPMAPQTPARQTDAKE